MSSSEMTSPADLRAAPRLAWRPLQGRPRRAGARPA
ncbi:MAG: hypothetical protein QOI35_3060, partial [Cryptosporangiaceae bacterium]|nr:hypothetical protein [Cryptosporangiaceae bacterium]